MYVCPMFSIICNYTNWLDWQLNLISLPTHAHSHTWPSISLFRCTRTHALAKCMKSEITTVQFSQMTNIQRTFTTIIHSPIEHYENILLFDKSHKISKRRMCLLFFLNSLCSCCCCCCWHFFVIIFLKIVTVTLALTHHTIRFYRLLLFHFLMALIYLDPTFAIDFKL